MIKTAVISGVCAILMVIPSAATIINVPGDYSTIQQGIDASADNDTVLVQPGFYIENINFNGHNIVVGSLFLTTGDESYIQQTTIDGDSAGSVVTFDNSETNSAVLTGFTIQNGASNIGAGIYCNGSDPVISHNIITGNLAYDINGGKGGGIFCYYSNLILIDNVIMANYASGALESWGGGIYCGYFAPTFSGNIVTQNLSLRGGGFYCLESDPLVTGNIINNNTGTFWGGGFYLDGSDPVIINSVIYGNEARWSEGGGLYLENNSQPVITNSILWADSAFTEGDEIYIENGLPTLSYTDIYGGWTGIGNMNEWPDFRDPENDDFHLMSTDCGDQFDSPLIDVGDPLIIDSLLACEAGLGTALSDLGVYGGGDSLITGIYDNPGMLPEGFALLQNYPNPFNAETIISFVSPRSGDVRLTVYDLLGREVEKLIDGEMPAGAHDVRFDASRLSSGVYLYRIDAEGYSQFKKMQFIK